MDASSAKNQTNVSVIVNGGKEEGRWQTFQGIVFGPESTRLSSDYFTAVDDGLHGTRAEVHDPNRGAGWGEVIDFLRREFLEIVGSVAGHSILDIAGGRGYVARALVDRSEEERPAFLYQTDLNTDVIIAASEAAREFPQYQPLVHTLGTPMPFEDGMFDTVLCKSVLHLLPEEVLDHTLSEAVRVAGEGKDIYVSFIHPEWLWKVDILEDYPHLQSELKESPFNEGLKLSRYGEGRPIYRPESWYVDKFESHGLQIVEVKEVLLPSPDSVEMFERFREFEGEPFYYICHLQTPGTRLPDGALS
jgi:hypothetical protein